MTSIDKLDVCPQETPGTSQLYLSLSAIFLPSLPQTVAAWQICTLV